VENEESSQRPEVFVKSITFNDNNTFEFNRSDIIVFTGANNSGKSQVLKEIYCSFQPKDARLYGLPKIATKVDSDFVGNIDLLINNMRRNSNGDYLFDGSWIAGITDN
jgi:AAA15 family ATPase/GTPase